MDDPIRSVNVYPWVQRSKSNNVRAVNKFTWAKVLKWRQNQIHEYLQFIWRTGGQVSQHHGSPRTDARLSTSARPCKSQHFAVEEPAKNKEMLTQDIQFKTKIFTCLKIEDLAFYQYTQDCIQDWTPWVGWVRDFSILLKEMTCFSGAAVSPLIAKPKRTLVLGYVSLTFKSSNYYNLLYGLCL